MRGKSEKKTESDEMSARRQRDERKETRRRVERDEEMIGKRQRDEREERKVDRKRREEWKKTKR